MSKTKGPKSDPSPNRGGEDEGVELWRRLTAEVKPIRRRKETRPPTPPKPSAPAPKSLASEATTSRVPVTTPPPTRALLSRTPPQAELGHGVAPGLDKRTLIKLRRGQFRIESRIDLHHCTQEQAHRALNAFLAASHAAGRRCVLVITGKGLKADGTMGVLRHGVPHWLNLPPNRDRVLAFCHAIPADGGEGALYVLLRRPR